MILRLLLPFDTNVTGGNILGLFSAKNKGVSQNDTLVQTALSNKSSHPFSLIDSYSPYCDKQLELYSALREAVPIVDAAISKLVRLLGTFEISCADVTCQKAMNSFLKYVRVNSNGCGINQFLSIYFDQLLTYGTAVGEIVMSQKNNDIYALYNAPIENLRFEKGDNPLEIKVMCKKNNGEFEAVQYPQLICMSALNPKPDSITGTSLLKGLPFVSNILLKIFNTIGINFERVGNVRFAVTYNPKDGASFNTKQRVQEIASQWSRAMRDKSHVCDFVSVGDVSVKVIGADNQVLSCDIEIKHLIEQIVSKLSIPPFLLGLSWSSTERMSSVQADILTSELEYYREILNPVVRQICRCYLRTNGYCDEFEIKWSNINLQDETELAQARLDNARAMQIESSVAEVNQ